MSWQPRCPSCRSYEVDFMPFTEGTQWKCLDCGQSFTDTPNSVEDDDDDLIQDGYWKG